jgi:hypothetical protein
VEEAAPAGAPAPACAGVRGWLCQPELKHTDVADRFELIKSRFWAHHLSAAERTTDL